MNPNQQSYSIEFLQSWNEATALPRGEASRRLSHFVSAVPERIAALQHATRIDCSIGNPRSAVEAIESWCIRELRSEYAHVQVQQRRLHEPRSEQDSMILEAFVRDSRTRTSLLPSQIAKAILLDVGIVMGQLLVVQCKSQWRISKRKNSRMYGFPYVALSEEWGLCPFVQPVTWFGRVYEDGAEDVLWAIYKHYSSNDANNG